jgi:hypothetical protein
MMSVEMQRAWEVAKQIDNELKSNDPRLRHCVQIEHDDGTRLFFDNAFIMRYYDKNHGDWGTCNHPGEWIFVFTEHHGFHVYPIDELFRYRQYQLVSQVEKHPDFPEDEWICDLCGYEFIEPKYPSVRIGDKAEHCPSCGLDEVRRKKDSDGPEVLQGTS